MNDEKDDSKMIGTARVALRRYVDPKRSVLLLLFSLLCANVIGFLAQWMAGQQVSASARATHARVYAAYEKAVDRNRRLVGTAKQGLQIQNMLSNLNGGHEGQAGQQASAHGTPEKPAPAASSPWWMALQDLKKEFPSLRIGIIVKSPVLDSIKNGPRGFTVSNDDSGWARSYFLLPTRNAAALTVSSFTKQELAYWRDQSVRLGIYTFLIFMAFGWFWMRALQDSENRAAALPREQQALVAAKIAEIRATLAAMATLTEDLRHGVRDAERVADLSTNPILKGIEESVNHIHLLAINGSLESLRSPDAQRVFHELLQEINQLSLKSKRLIGKLEGQERSAFARLDDRIRAIDETLRKAG